jgi:hypothetical protein
LLILYRNYLYEGKFKQRHVYAETQLGIRLEKDTNKMTLVLPGLQEEDSAAELLMIIN